MTPAAQAMSFARRRQWDHTTDILAGAAGIMRPQAAILGGAAAIIAILLF